MNDTEWANLTNDEKIRMRREARARATARERERRRPVKSKAASPPQWTYSATAQLEADGFLTAYCEVGDHSRCARPMRCTCKCHDRRSTDE